MKRIIRTAFIFALPFLLKETEASNANEATIYRDEFGIPHIFAVSLEKAAHAVGYAQAEDRLEELLKNYRKANGTMGEVFGPSHLHDDMIQRMFRHGEISHE